jgi:hypothetical protein
MLELVLIGCLSSDMSICETVRMRVRDGYGCQQAVLEVLQAGVVTEDGTLVAIYCGPVAHERGNTLQEYPM